jgi:hypothetical protein
MWAAHSWPCCRRAGLPRGPCRSDNKAAASVGHVGRGAMIGGRGAIRRLHKQGDHRLASISPIARARARCGCKILRSGASLRGGSSSPSVLSQRQLRSERGHWRKDGTRQASPLLIAPNPLTTQFFFRHILLFDCAAGSSLAPTPDHRGRPRADAVKAGRHATLIAI